MIKKFLKWAAIIVGCFVVVIIAALILIPMFVDVAKYKPMLESKVTEATGRPFSVGDDLSLSLFPWAGVSFSDLRLGNPAGFTEKDFKVKLGSIVESEFREYYAANRFGFLKEKLTAMLS